jgi:hypothetical protein
VEEEVYILGATLLASPRGPQRVDMMHMIKNLCVNMLGFMGVYGKHKDTLEAPHDLQHMKE